VPNYALIGEMGWAEGILKHYKFCQNSGIFGRATAGLAESNGSLPPGI